MESTTSLFPRLIGTLAVILLVSAYIGSTHLLHKRNDRQKKWQFVLGTGLFGGLFGVYGNLAGIELKGAVASVRDIGPMLAGFMGGPVSGLVAGVIAGLHRLSMGGVTAVACVVATTLIGLLCGILAHAYPAILKKYQWTLLVGVAMEALHLCIVLLLVKPYSTALEIVCQVALPFISVNGIGIAVMMAIIHYIETQQDYLLDRQRMKSELEVASVIQHSLLPSLTDKYPGRPEISVSASMQAAKVVGGDFYDVFFVDNDRIAFVIGDVSGKGVPAALFMASLKSILQNCIRDTKSLPEAFYIANNLVCEKNEAGMFVTVWAGILDLNSGSLTCVSAGHNPPVLVRSGYAEFMKIKNGFVLAGLENTKYKETQFQLKEGDTVFLYTDGVTEATTDENELYGNDRLLACLADSSYTDVNVVLKKVQNSIDEFVRDNEQFDDITMLCLTWK